ncbi:hypothetical protein [Nonomuraea polychroma]|uniref:hypothetical protein n=1 Tax=Nonomuraea polychroma TaxID=46176 RepID=UPI000FDD057E|nr:hypothetical protein [Nonomuraea polychroma]
MSENDLEDRAFDELFPEATRDPALRDQLRSAYALLVKELGAAIRRDRPDSPHDASADHADLFLAAGVVGAVPPCQAGSTRPDRP